MRFAWLLLSGILLASCELAIKDSANKAPAKITPTTGVFTSQEEAVYEERFAEMIKAFSSGKFTTNYDTEISFGEKLKEIPLPRGEAKKISSDVISELMQYAEVQNSDSFMIFENGHVVSERFFGEKNRESLINSKSLSKPLGVIAIGRAIKLGFIESLDQPVSDFIIEWKGTDKEKIKIRHLLDMRSGLLAQNRARGIENVLNRAYLHPRHDEVIIHEYPLINPPASRYDYSNANAELVAVIINRATSQTYSDWIANEVFSLIGAKAGTVWMNRAGGTAHSGCCMALPSETYLKLGVLVLQKGMWDGKELLPPGFVDTMLTATPQNIYAGMGVYLGKNYIKERGAANPDGKAGFRGGTLHSEPYIDKDIALFDGNGNQVVYIMPSRDLVIMRLGGRPRSEQPWDNAYIPNTVSRALDAQ